MKYILFFRESKKEITACLFRVLPDKSELFDESTLNNLLNSSSPRTKATGNLAKANRKIIQEVYSHIINDWGIKQGSQLNLIKFNRRVGAATTSGETVRSVTLPVKFDLRRKIKEQFIRNTITNRIPPGNYRVLFFNDGGALINGLMKWLHVEVDNESIFEIQ